MQQKKILMTFVPHPEDWVHNEGVVTPLHPPHNIQEGESATRNGLVSAATSFEVLTLSRAAYVTINWLTPGLVCRIETNQYWSEDVRLLQAPVQLTGHKRSLTEEPLVTCCLLLLLSDSCLTASLLHRLLSHSFCLTPPARLTPISHTLLSLSFSVTPST